MFWDWVFGIFNVGLIGLDYCIGVVSDKFCEWYCEFFGWFYLLINCLQVGLGRYFVIVCIMNVGVF